MEEEIYPGISKQDYDMLMYSEVGYFSDDFLKIFINANITKKPEANMALIEDHIRTEMGKQEPHLETINGMKFIISNQVDYYLASLIANMNPEYNQYIDKTFRIVTDENLYSDTLTVNEQDNIVTINMGILNRSYLKLNKGNYLKYNPEQRRKMLNDQLKVFVESIEFSKSDFNPNAEAIQKGFYDQVPIIKRIISSLLESYEDSIAEDLAAPTVELKEMSQHELYEMALQFFNKYDKTGNMCTLLTKAVTEDRITDPNNDDSHVDIDTGDIYVDYKGNSQDFILLVHEMMHHNSVEKKNNQFDVASEFPSIYFEYLAKYFAEEMGRKTDFSIIRNKESIKRLYSILFSLDLIELYENKQYNQEKISEVIAKYNLPEEKIIEYLVADPPQTLLQSTPYLVGILLTKHSLAEGIEPGIIQDISDHLEKYSLEEIATKLNVPGFTNSNELDEGTSIKM